MTCSSSVTLDARSLLEDLSLYHLATPQSFLPLAWASGQAEVEMSHRPVSLVGSSLSMSPPTWARQISPWLPGAHLLCSRAGIMGCLLVTQINQ